MVLLVHVKELGSIVHASSRYFGRNFGVFHLEGISWVVVACEKHNLWRNSLGSMENKNGQLPL